MEEKIMILGKVGEEGSEVRWKGRWIEVIKRLKEILKVGKGNELGVFVMDRWLVFVLLFFFGVLFDVSIFEG